MKTILAEHPTHCQHISVARSDAVGNLFGESKCRGEPCVRPVQAPVQSKHFKQGEHKVRPYNIVLLGGRATGTAHTPHLLLLTPAAQQC